VSASVASQAVGRGFIILHLVGAGVTWGCAFLFMKLMAGDVHLTVIAAGRAILAAFVLAAGVALVGQSVLPQRREWRDWLILGCVNGWAPNMLVAYALTQMESGPAAMIQASGPLLTALLAHAVPPGERLTATRIVGIGVGAAGMALLIGPAAFSGGGTALGILAMAALTLGYAIGNVYARTIPAADPTRLALGQQTVSAFFGAAIALWFAGAAGFGKVTEHGATMLALGVFSTALPIWLFMRLITYGGPTRASMVGYVAPTVAVAMGVLVLGEPVVPRQILGGVVILLGVAIVTGLLRLPLRRPA
jgi:drug/metabolite transporter (DMT)-like permease